VLASHLLSISTRDRETRHNLGVLVILGSISTSLRCLTRNPRTKTHLPRGLFPVVEGRVPRSIFRPFNIAESPAANDRVSNCFPAAPTGMLLLSSLSPRERERERERERDRRSHSAVRAKPQWTRLIFPPLRFFIALVPSQDSFDGSKLKTAP